MVLRRVKACCSEGGRAQRAGVSWPCQWYLTFPRASRLRDCRLWSNNQRQTMVTPDWRWPGYLAERKGALQHWSTAASRTPLSLSYPSARPSNSYMRNGIKSEIKVTKTKVSISVRNSRNTYRRVTNHWELLRSARLCSSSCVLCSVSSPR